jgi:hypothetical protein
VACEIVHQAAVDRGDVTRRITPFAIGRAECGGSSSIAPHTKRGTMCNRATAILSLCLLAVASSGCMTAFAAFQPENIGGPTIVITTTDADGTSHDRVLSPIDDGDQLFVAANHWPRAWYHRALENPSVRVTRDGETVDYRAVAVSEAERKRLFAEHGFPWLAYLFTGFAPREFLRLDPR